MKAVLRYSGCMLLLFLFFLGLVIGSFLNVAVLRGREGKPLTGRSHCPHCKRVLTTRELIPVVSFLLQKKRCRSCKTRISWQYPLVELGTGLSFALAGLLFLPSFNLWRSDLHSFYFILMLVGISAAIAIFVSDIRFEVIPDGATLILFVLGLATVVIRGHILSDVVAATGATLTFFSIWFFSKGRAMGMGDVKLVPATSLILGYPASILGFLFSFWLGGIIAVALLLGAKKGLKSRMPFGPFILLGAIGAYFGSDVFLAFFPFL